MRREIRLREAVQSKLEEALGDLEEETHRRVILEGVLPICSYCRQITDEHDEWSHMETYIRNHSEADFSHSICPPCYTKHFPGFSLPKP